nr:antA/AntB antirepressor family protein [Sellimonas sp.]
MNYDTEQPTVSARELHKALAIEKRFSTWFDTNSQGFVEGEDFSSVLTSTVVNNGAQRELQNYEYRRISWGSNKSVKGSHENHECKTVERKNAFNTVTDLFTVIKI